MSPILGSVEVVGKYGGAAVVVVDNAGPLAPGVVRMAATRWARCRASGFRHG